MKRIASIILMLILVGSGVQVSAQVMDYIPYDGYEYNSYGESVPSPAGYTPEKVYTGASMGVGMLSSPSDLLFSPDGALYILDSGNGRILVTDKSMKPAREIKAFTNNEGESLSFQGAQGMFVERNGDIYLADTENARVIIADKNCRVKLVLTHPDSPSYPEIKAFRPTKVICDENGYIYVLSDGLNEGAVGFDGSGKFIGFFGYNRVAATADVVFDYLSQNFMTKEQKAASKARVPDQITNFDIDERGFLYTVTSTSGAQQNVRRLNFKGAQTLADAKYGDLEWDRKFTKSVKTKFVDADLDPNGYINLLDQARGRVFQYNTDGSLITVFGGQSGVQLGTFSNAVAIETRKDRIYVLDSIQNSITTFVSTKYSQLIKQAISLTTQGMYDQSLVYWDQVRRLNSNNELSYQGIGKAYSESGKFKEALPYYRLANNHAAYSEAFAQVRKDFVRAHFILLMTGAVILIIGMVVIGTILKRRYARSYPDGGSMLDSRFTYPLYTALHPFDGFTELKAKRKGSYPVSFAILLLLFFTLCAAWFFTGFIFNESRASDFNVFIPAIQAFLLFFLWVVSNWAMSTLMEGKGRMKEIVSMSAYALVPFLVAMAVQIGASHIFTLSEASIVSFIGQFGMGWSAVLMIIGICEIHQFSFGKAILDIVITLLTMAVIVFFAVLFYGLMLQLFNFIGSVYTEIRLMKS